MLGPGQDLRSVQGASIRTRWHPTLHLHSVRKGFPDALQSDGAHQKASSGFPLFLRAMRQALCHIHGGGYPLAHPHRRATLHMWPLRQVLQDVVLLRHPPTPSSEPVDIPLPDMCKRVLREESLHRSHELPLGDPQAPVHGVRQDLHHVRQPQEAHGAAFGGEEVQVRHVRQAICTIRQSSMAQKARAQLRGASGRPVEPSATRSFCSALYNIYKAIVGR